MIFPLDAGTALLSAAVLLFQIALTRVFSIMLWHHFAYLVISIALLGYGAAGSWLAVRGSDDRAPLARRAAWFAFTLLAAVPAASLFGLNPEALREDATQFARLAALYLVISVPFLFAGLCIGSVLSRHRDIVNRLYFADLLGAGLGGVLAVPVMDAFGAVTAIAVAAALGGAAALFYGLRDGRITGAVTAVATLAVAVWALLPRAGDAWRIPPAPGKEIVKYGFLDKVDHIRWGATARIEVARPDFLPPMIGGAWKPGLPAWPQRYVFQDGAAPTALFANEGDIGKLEILGHSTSAVPHQLLGPGKDVLVIGVGGGIDVMTALYHRCAHVTGAEINKAMVKTLLDDFRDFTKDVFRRPDVDIVVAEGRSFVRHSDRKYDLIQLSGVDTYTALSSGAYALAESYLYTVEAIEDFLGHCKPGGLVAIARFHTPGLPRETLRLAAVSQEALWRRGATEPWRHLFLTGGTMGVLLIKNEPFTKEQIDVVARFSTEEQFGCVFNPFEPRDEPFNQLLRAPDRAARDAFLAGYRFDASPCTDDRPFFFNYFKWKNLFESKPFEVKPGETTHIYWEEFPLGHLVLLAGVLQIVLLAALFILWPLRRLRASDAGGGGRLGILLYFGALGLGFMFLEVALMQKLTVFLGHPIYAISLVLATLLVAAGCGSLLSARLTASRGTLVRLGLAIVAMLGGVLVALPWLLEHLLGASQTVRFMAAACLVVPVGLVLGCPFPLGLRLLAQHRPGLVPWAFGINGFASVLGGLLSILLAMQIGLSGVIVVAGVIYVVGVLAARSVLATPQPATEVRPAAPVP